MKQRRPMRRSREWKIDPNAPREKAGFAYIYDRQSRDWVPVKVEARG